MADLRPDPNRSDAAKVSDPSGSEQARASAHPAGESPVVVPAEGAGTPSVEGIRAIVRERDLVGQDSGNGDACPLGGQAVHGHPDPHAASSRGLVRATVEVGAWDIPLEVQQAAMGIDWMTVPELSQAIPPAYTEHIGLQLLAHLDLGAERVA